MTGLPVTPGVVFGRKRKVASRLSESALMHVDLVHGMLLFHYVYESHDECVEGVNSHYG